MVTFLTGWCVTWAPNVHGWHELCRSGGRGRGMVCPGARCAANDGRPQPWLLPPPKKPLATGEATGRRRTRVHLITARQTNGCCAEMRGTGPQVLYPGSSAPNSQLPSGALEKAMSSSWCRATTGWADPGSRVCRVVILPCCWSGGECLAQSHRSGGDSAASGERLGGDDISGSWFVRWQSAQRCEQAIGGLRGCDAARAPLSWEAPARAWNGNGGCRSV